ncbi:hypothetical protein DL96DRAFT_1594475 [Flagelloscypha sp. PMI_526]|nr:hypothetical protein DL96DRAFT_1594475 [Flagelloscypha sp. PMI_526]
MTSIMDAPPALSQKMLEGWALTSKTCSTPGCNLPLLRSPRGVEPQVHECVNCPQNKQAGPSARSPSLTVSTASSVSHISRASTPPTEISSTPGSPTFVPPPPSEESIRRREQSDRASAEIARRMLQGYAMLGEECINEACVGIPLVRPPSNGTDKDPRKECVVCGAVYTLEATGGGPPQLVPFNSPAPANKSSRDQPSSQGSSASTRTPSKQVSSTWPTPIEEEPTLKPNEFPVILQPAVLPSPPRSNKTNQQAPSDLAFPEQALRQALKALSERLSAQSSGSRLDPSSIADTSDAILKTTLALGELVKLRKNEE